METTRQWLEDLGLARYADVFEDNALELDLVRDLSDSDLEKLGVFLMGHRKKLLRAIGSLATASFDGNAAGAPMAQPAQFATIQEAPPSSQTARATGERRQLTVMFCDLVGSTELSTRFDPEDLQEIIRAYQRTCAIAIEQYGGYIAKYMGDGLLVYFGYPQAHENDAEGAARTGLGIVAAMADLNFDIGARMGVDLSVRIGIDTGLVVVGDIVGEAGAEEASVTGETPNVAARLQALAEPDQVVIGRLTRELVGDMFACEDLGEHSLRGIAEPVRAWLVLHESDANANIGDSPVGAKLPLVGRQEPD